MGELIFDSYVNQIRRAVANRYDDFIFEQFEKCGYSKQDVIRAGIEGRIISKMITYPFRKDTQIIKIGIDGVFLFEIGFGDTEFNSYGFSYAFDAKLVAHHYKDVEKKGE